MPYTKTYVDHGKGLHKTGIGIVTGQEILNISLHDADDEEVARRLRYGLLDFSLTTEMRVSEEEMHRIVEANRKIASLTTGGKVAVISPTDMTFAMSRMWHSLSLDFGWKSNLFRNRPDAIAWLKKQLVSGEDPGEYPSLN